MISTTGTTKTRKFQEQLIPAYLNSGLDFSYELSLFSPSEDVLFGVKSSNGSGLAQYKLKSGIVYDYSDRFVSTYRGGELKINYGLKSGLISGDLLPSYFSYEEINSHPISYEDKFSGYQNNPFDRFFITNNGSSDLEFDLTIKGFSPPTIYSNLVGIGSGIFSGNITQSGLSDYPSQGVKYGMFGISIPSGQGQVTQFQESGSGGLYYLVSGKSLFNGQEVNVEFDSYFGKFNYPIVATTGSSSLTSDPETGISISIHGETNILQPLGSLFFEIDYYSNGENDVLVELAASGSFSSPLLSGSGAGFLDYEGFVRKSGQLYSNQYITGVADLLAAQNTPFNTQYSLVDQYIDIQKLAPSRTSGVFYEGDTEFTLTGISMVGIYNGPYAPFSGYAFSGLGDITFTQEYLEVDEGVVYLNENKSGFLNSSYSNFFYISPDITTISSGIAQNALNVNIFPTGSCTGLVSGFYTGEGNMTRQEFVPSFFGEGTGRVLNGRIALGGSGTGIITYSGNCYDWITYDNRGVGPAPYFAPGALADELQGGVFSQSLTPVRGKGRLTNGIQTFDGTGMPVPYALTWGYPTGPSEIVIPPLSMKVVKDLAITTVTGWFLTGSAPVFSPTGFGFTGRATGYANYEGGVFNGPIFPSPEDTGFYPYYGDNGRLKSEGDSFYGRGVIYASGGTDNGVTQYGLYLTNPNGTFDATFDIVSGGNMGTYTSGVDRIYLPDAYIRPATYEIDVNGDQVINVRGRSYTLFPEPDYEKFETGFISGIGYVPASDLNEKFDITYSETDGSFNPLLSYKTLGYFTPFKFVKLDGIDEVPYPYPSGYKKGYVKIDSTSPDVDSFEEIVLKVSANGITGDVSILTGF